MDQFQTEFASPIPMQKPESSFSILSEKQSVEAVSYFVSTFLRKNDRVNVSIGGGMNFISFHSRLPDSRPTINFDFRVNRSKFRVIAIGTPNFKQ